jgi:hypothetical protein
VFDEWLERFAAVLTAHGYPRRRAERLATLTVSAVEGAVVLCRARRSSTPLDDVIDELSPLLTVGHHAAAPRQPRPRAR